MKGNTQLTFGEAIELLKAGKMVQRTGWNGKGMFVFMQIPASISADIVPKMQSLPDSVKYEFKNRFENWPKYEGDNNAIHYSNQMALVNMDNQVTGWAPSASDSLANDWVELR